MVKQLVSANGDNWKMKQISECAPAIWAASAAGHVHVVEALLNAGVDVNQTTSSNSTALRGACYDGHLDVVICLVRNKANVEIGNRHKHTPLMIAAYREQTQIVRYLLSIGANPNAVSSKGINLILFITILDTFLRQYGTS
jgi:ankyrin repeat protein